MMRMQRWALFGAMLMIWGWGGFALAQDSASPRVEPSTLKQLDRLDADEYRTRQAATRHLLQNQSLGRPQLRALFKRADSPEQRYRLMSVALHHTVRRMIDRQNADDSQGALGIAHRAVRPTERDHGHGQKKTGGIRVTRVLAGFPAYAYLQPGDLIVKVDGKPLPSDIDGAGFARMIQGRAKGQPISLTIDHRGERRQVRFDLGSAKALRSVYSDNQIGLSFRYARKWERVKRGYEDLIPGVTELKPES